MLSLRFEGVSEQQKSAIEACAARMVSVTTFATTVGDARISRWFGDQALSGGTHHGDFHS